MRHFWMIFFLLAALPAVAAPSPALVAGEGIAAVVGGDAVSYWDVANRVKFIIVTAKLSNTPDVLERIRPQVIRSLIDEKLQLQEAARNDIKVSDDDISHAIADIETQRNMPPGAIDGILQDNNVPKTTFIQQVHAQLAWNKLLAKKIRPHVRISDEEIAMASRQAALPPSKPATVPQELQIAVLTLSVDKPSREAEVRKLGDKLAREMRSGASFEEVSRQFSSGGKAETFWVAPRQLDPHIAHALVGASKGTITEPVRTNEGYTIIKVYNTRAIGGAPATPAEAPAQATETQVTLKEILLKLKPDAPNKEAGVLLQIAEEVAKNPGTCQEKSVAGLSNPEEADIEVDFRPSLLSQLPPALKLIADGLKLGEISTPFASDDGIRLYMLCDKKEVAAGTPDREQIFRMLMQQKMELEAQKYMRNLRREAFIEMR